jgi:Cu2+-exporting ATPase
MKHNQHEHAPSNKHEIHSTHAAGHQHDHPVSHAHGAHEAGAKMHAGEHAAQVDHAGHEEMFRKRFWGSLLLSIPVLLYTPMLQMWFGFMMPEFMGSQWIAPLFSVLVFLYGGIPFIQMAVPEIRNRQPGMMMLVSLAISVSFIYSLAALWLNLGEGFFWELVTLIDIMLLGHWIEMRSVRQASGALDTLAKLMPDTAEHILPNGNIHTMPVSELKAGDLVLVRPGQLSLQMVVKRVSQMNVATITGEFSQLQDIVGCDCRAP